MKHDIYFDIYLVRSRNCRWASFQVEFEVSILYNDESARVCPLNESYLPGIRLIIVIIAVSSDIRTA